MASCGRELSSEAVVRLSTAGPRASERGPCVATTQLGPVPSSPSRETTILSLHCFDGPTLRRLPTLRRGTPAGPTLALAPAKRVSFREQRAQICGEPPPCSRAVRVESRFRVAASHLSHLRWQSLSHRRCRSAACRPLPRRISRALHAHAPMTRRASSALYVGGLPSVHLAPNDSLSGSLRPPHRLPDCAEEAGHSSHKSAMLRLFSSSSSAGCTSRKIDPVPRAFARRRQALAQTIGVRQRQLVLVPERSCSPADSRQSVSRGPSDGAGPAAWAIEPPSHCATLLGLGSHLRTWKRTGNSVVVAECNKRQRTESAGG